MLSPQNTAWVAAFQREHGRRPRVLHVGNIANNAYCNAKLLNEVGFDCDVLCYDYYHSMGCPEWEDADFDGSLENDFSPDWSSLDLKGFERPEWFAQGPIDLSIEYLLARREGRAFATRLGWLTLSLVNRTLRGTLLQRWTAKAWRVASRSGRRLARILDVTPQHAYRRFALRLAPRLGAPVARVCALAPMLVWGTARAARILAFGTGGRAEAASKAFDSRCVELAQRWRTEFPERSDVLTVEELADYGSLVPAFDRLFKAYDIIIGYATDPIHPLLAGRAYFAIEHGTIRSIPYDATTQGRCAALSYRLATHVFVTNFDCRASAQRLAPGRFTSINHPYDEDHGLRLSGWETVRHELQRELDADFLCFFPTRHDWVEGAGFADKANDVFLRGVAELVREGRRIGVICCAWGGNVVQSRDLIQDLGLAQRVKWVAPMPLSRFERTARACDVTVDQFKLGAFGGVLYKAMAVGSPVLTYLDERQLLEQYAEMPPVLNCRTVSDVVQKLRDVVGHPEKLARKREASRAWMLRHHGKRSTLNAQVDQFRIAMGSLATSSSTGEACQPQRPAPASTLGAAET